MHSATCSSRLLKTRIKPPIRFELKRQVYFFQFLSDSDCYSIGSRNAAPQFTTPQPHGPIQEDESDNLSDV
jgi:hypothetical protein